MDEGIDRYVDLCPAQVRIVYRPRQLLIAEIRTVFPCPEPFAAEIDGIGTMFHGLNAKISIFGRRE